MPVKQRGNSWEASATKEGRRFRRSFTTKPEAVQWEAEAKAALARGESPEMPKGTGVAAGMNLEELLAYTVKHRWSGKSKSLERNGQTAVDTIGPTVQVSAVDTQTVDRCIQIWANKGNSGSTINRKLASLSTMLTEAQRLGIIAQKPYLRRQKESESRLRFYSHAEQSQIVDYFRHIGQEDIADLCIVAVETGLRLGTLLDLEAKDVEIRPEGQRSWLRIPGRKLKNGKNYDAPLSALGEAVLAPRVKAGGNLFTCAYHSVQHYWKGMRSHLGRDDDEQFVFHVFRHTFCSRLVQAGVPIHVVQKLAGHETIQMTMRYAHLAPQNLESAMDSLEGKEKGP